MTIKNHPTDISLGAFVTGSLDEARALVVATHVALCARCRTTLANFEGVAGEMLQALPPTPMSAGALFQALTRLDTPSAGRAPIAATHSVDDIRLPAPLAAYQRGPWRWLGRGIEFSVVDVPDVHDGRVFLLKAKPGIRLPPHKHTGTEWTCVINGSFSHDGGHFGAGDFDEADETVEHHPVVGEGETCICIVALHGQVRLKGWAGVLLQPLLRF